MNSLAAWAAAALVTLEISLVPSPAAPASDASPPPPLSLGTFEVLPGLAGLVVAAPHEGFDLRTAEVASGAATVLGAGYVVASGFRTRGHPIEASRGPLRLLVEVHGNSRRENVGVVEVATVGLDKRRASALKATLEARFQGVRFLVEPVDVLHYQGEGTKQGGTLSRFGTALQIEFPWALRSPGAARDTGQRLGAALGGWLGVSTATASAVVGGAR